MATITVEKIPTHLLTRVQNRALHGSDGCGDLPRTPTHDQIAQRAYQIYVANDCSKGRCELNWSQAERQLNESTEVTSPVKS